MTPFCSGDQVKLTDRFAKARMFGAFQKRKSRINWPKRRGVICRVNSNTVLVVWDGCSSGEPLPVAAVERVIS